MAPERLVASYQHYVGEAVLHRAGAAHEAAMLGMMMCVAASYGHLREMPRDWGWAPIGVMPETEPDG